MENRNDIKIYVANIISMFSALLFIVGVLGVFTLIKEHEFFGLTRVFIFIFSDGIIYCTMNIWKDWIVQEKCDYEAQEAYIRKLLNWKRYKKHVGLHLGLLYTSLMLGRCDESGNELETLYGLKDRLNNRQNCNYSFII